MISFIIIGKNEGWKITKCVESVINAIDICKIGDYEIIYVDSNSSDDSITRVKKYNLANIIIVNDESNAAVARNIGVLESKGDALFFIDGDMEIEEDFLNSVYNDKGGLRYDFVSGNWINKEYNNDWVYQKERLAKKINSSQIREFTTGGVFLIKKSLWIMIGGMKSKLNRSQDLDFGIRLAKKGHFLLRKNTIIANHHTIPYNDENRMWRLLFSGDLFYRVVLLRDNFLNYYQWKLFIRGNYTFFILYILLLLSLISSNFFLMVLYLFSIITRTYIRGAKSVYSLSANVLLLVIHEILLFPALFFFWPKNKKQTYRIIK